MKKQTAAHCAIVVSLVGGSGDAGLQPQTVSSIARFNITWHMFRSRNIGLLSEFAS